MRKINYVNSVPQFNKSAAADKKNNDEIHCQNRHRPQGHFGAAANAPQQIAGVGEGQAFDKDPQGVGQGPGGKEGAA